MISKETPLLGSFGPEPLMRPCNASCWLVLDLRQASLTDTAEPRSSRDWLRVSGQG